MPVSTNIFSNVYGIQCEHLPTGATLEDYSSSGAAMKKTHFQV